MATTASDVLIDVLYDWGVRVVFGLPGDGINGIMEALRKRQDEIRFVQVRHEESAALMACAYAKYTGRLGVCLATSGPGGIHLLNGLYDAKMDGQPVLAITGHHYHDLIDTFSQQDVNLDRLFVDVALYSTRIMGKAHVENVANLACRMALDRRGVSHINFPVDLQDEESDRRSPHNVPHHSDGVDTYRGPTPSPENLTRAAEVLNAGKAITILAAMELGKRRKLADVIQRDQITGSQSVYEIFHPTLCDLPHEEFWVLLLNQANRVISRVKISQGGVAATSVDVKLILKSALLALSPAIILCHNHPSGNRQPSSADDNLTRKIVTASREMDIRVLDHLIVCDGHYYSYADEGKI